MKKLIILLLVVLYGCCPTIPNKEKPFIIIQKYAGSSNCGRITKGGGRYCSYTYQDATGQRTSFCDVVDAYQVGDTIK